MRILAITERMVHLQRHEQALSLLERGCDCAGFETRAQLAAAKTMHAVGRLQLASLLKAVPASNDAVAGPSAA